MNRMNSFDRFFMS